MDARLADDLAVAERALDEAADLGLSPPRLALERARLAVVEEAPDMALVELERLAASGFTAVSAISEDPVLSSLTGLDTAVLMAT